MIHPVLPCRRISAISLTALLLLIGVPPAVAQSLARQADKRVDIVKLAPGEAITIDGSLDDWTAESLLFTFNPNMLDSSDINAAETNFATQANVDAVAVHARWDDQRLYLAANVSGDGHGLNRDQANALARSSLIAYLSSNNADAAGTRQADHYSAVLGAVRADDAAAGNNDAQARRGDGQGAWIDAGPGGEVAGSGTTGVANYGFEFAVDWETLTGETVFRAAPNEGDIWAFDVLFVQGTHGAFQWDGGAGEDPLNGEQAAGWGEARFVGAPVSDTPTFTATFTPVDTPINTPTNTSTEMPTNTPTNTATNTPSPTSTGTPVPPTLPPSPSPTGPHDDQPAVGYMVLDGFGGIHAVGLANNPARGYAYRANAPYWNQPGIARDLVVDRRTPRLDHALITDLYGGVHYVNWENNFDIVRNHTAFYWFPEPVAVDSELTADGDGAYVLATDGRIGLSGETARGRPFGPLPNLAPFEYRSLELYIGPEQQPGGTVDVVLGGWAMDQRGNVIAFGQARAPNHAEQAAIGGGHENYVDLEVIPNGNGDVVFVTLDALGAVRTSGPLPQDVDLSPLPFFGFPHAVDMEWQTAQEGDLSQNNLPGIVMLDAFGGVYGTAGAALRPDDTPGFGFPIAVDIEVGDFSSPPETGFVTGR